MRSGPDASNHHRCPFMAYRPQYRVNFAESSREKACAKTPWSDCIKSGPDGLCQSSGPVPPGSLPGARRGLVVQRAQEMTPCLCAQRLRPSFPPSRLAERSAMRQCAVPRRRGPRCSGHRFVPFWSNAFCVVTRQRRVRYGRMVGSLLLMA